MGDNCGCFGDKCDRHSEENVARLEGELRIYESYCVRIFHQLEGAAEGDTIEARISRLGLRRVDLEFEVRRLHYGIEHHPAGVELANGGNDNAPDRHAEK